MRLDAYLAEYWPDRSRSEWQKLCKAECVTVNGVVVVVSKTELDEDDIVKVNSPVTPDFSAESLPILYEDDNVTVINKPVSVLTHAKGAPCDEFTVGECMRARTTDKPEGNRPGIVHRLDRDTSGVIICARTPDAQSFLQKQFSDRKVKKTYLAILDGIPKQREAILRLPIERNPKMPSMFRVGANGKPAETHCKVLWADKKYSLVELKPLTGRTHQLRVHMSYLKTPILNDRFYGNNVKPKNRLGLHAYQLEITIPGGKRMSFTAPLPDNLTAMLAKEAWHGLV